MLLGLRTLSGVINMSAENKSFFKRWGRNTLRGVIVRVKSFLTNVLTSPVGFSYLAHKEGRMAKKRDKTKNQKGR